jgi:Tol biopolymer transport system component
MEGPDPKPQRIIRMDLARSQTRQVCADCGDPTSVSPSGEFVIHQTGSRISRLAVLHVPSEERREILRHAHHAVEAGRFSPDGRWIAFTLNDPDGSQIFLAPFKALEPIESPEWIPVSDPAVSSFEPAWAPDGKALYFLSDRTGSRDLWRQTLDDRKRPQGDARLVRSFPDLKLTPLHFHSRPSSFVGLSITSGYAALALNELSSRIWTAQIDSE